jgi:hypothetical protein
MLSCNEKRAEKHSATHLAASVTSLLLLLLLLVLLLLLLAAALSFFGGERGRSMLIEMRVFKC